MDFLKDIASSVATAFQPLLLPAISALSVVATQVVKQTVAAAGAKIPAEAKPFVNLFLGALIAQLTGADPGMGAAVSVAGSQAYDSYKNKRLF